jgi:integrase
MPKLTSRNPAYRRHASGQAIVTLNGQDVYLGPHGTAASKREYDRVVGEWLARGRQLPQGTDTFRVADLIKAYWDHARGYYGAGDHAGELNSIKLMLSVLRRAYGDELANGFGPLALQVLREQMVGIGWSRTYINAQIGRLKRCFKWAGSRELIAPSVFHGLLAVDGLRKGKTDAEESEPVTPVDENLVEKTLQHVSPQVSGLIRLMLASGMRPGEAVIMRRCDLDTSGKVWLYTPERHKTEHHGHGRKIYLGPQAQEIVKEFLKPDLHAYLFSPIDAECGRRATMHEKRKTPLNQGNRPGSNKRRRRERAPSDRYTVDSFRRAIDRATDTAFPPSAELARRRVTGNKGAKSTRWETEEEWQARLGKEKWTKLQRWREEHHWHPHQLRHNAATRLRRLYGLEAARVVLGQKSAAVAEIYAEIDYAKAEAIMGEVG